MGLLHRCLVDSLGVHCDPQMSNCSSNSKWVNNSTFSMNYVIVTIFYIFIKLLMWPYEIVSYWCELRDRITWMDSSVSWYLIILVCNCLWLKLCDCRSLCGDRRSVWLSMACVIARCLCSNGTLMWRRDNKTPMWWHNISFLMKYLCDGVKPLSLWHTRGMVRCLCGDMVWLWTYVVPSDNVIGLCVWFVIL